MAKSAGVQALPAEPRKVAVVSLEPALHAVLLSVEPFRAANRLSRSDLFHVEFLSPTDTPVETPVGIPIPTTARFGDRTLFDLVLLHSSYEFSGRRKGQLLNWLRRQAASGAHICGIDTAPLLLAEAGLLTGYTATSHWSTIASFREMHPDTNVVEQLFVVDRDRSTCAGQVACLDYSLFMLESYCGSWLRTIVGNEIVYTSSRSDVSQQRNIINSNAWHTNPVLLEAERLMRETIENPLSISSLAARCGVSTRELQYLFSRHLKASPKNYYLTFRLQRARELLLYSTLGVRETGLASGFTSSSTYFRAFRDRFGVSPLNYRKAFQGSSSTPDGRRIY